MQTESTVYSFGQSNFSAFLSNARSLILFHRLLFFLPYYLPSSLFLSLLLTPPCPHFSLSSHVCHKAMDKSAADKTICLGLCVCQKVLQTPNHLGITLATTMTEHSATIFSMSLMQMCVCRRESERVTDTERRIPSETRKKE